MRQYKVLQQKKPPKVLEGEVSQEVFDKSQVCIDRFCTVQSPSSKGMLKLDRHMVAQKPSLASSPVSMVKSKTSRSFTTMRSQSSGR